MKPKKCDACKYLYRVKLINAKKKIFIATKGGRIKQHYRCGKVDRPYSLVRYECEGPYKEAVK